MPLSTFKSTHVRGIATHTQEFNSIHIKQLKQYNYG